MAPHFDTYHFAETLFKGVKILFRVIKWYLALHFWQLPLELLLRRLSNMFSDIEGTMEKEVVNVKSRKKKLIKSLKRRKYSLNL